VRLELLIDRRHRRSVTDKTEFWVARPRLSGGLVGGMSLEDVSAILSPFVSYYTEPGDGLPVSDGYLVAAEVQRPEIKLAKVSTEGMADPAAPSGSQDEKSVQLVRVIYSAEEEDWLSANDHISREGTGILWEASDGQRMVLTTRSVCDASYFERDTFGGSPDIIKEGIRINLIDGTIIRARRTWAAEGGRDLALLTLDLEFGAEAPPVTPEALLWFDPPALPENEKPDLLCRALDAERRVKETELAEGAPPATLEGARGAVVLSDGHVVGMLGQTSGTDETPKIEPISQLPESLRPRK